jgi:hypothetical protein
MNKMWMTSCALFICFVCPALGADKPPPRSRAEAQRALAQSTPAPKSSKPLRLTLVASKQDHGPGEHDYPAWQTNWAKLLGKAPGVAVTSAWKWPETFTNIDVVVFYFWNHDWSAERYKQLDEFLANGGGVVVLHSATIADK